MIDGLTIGLYASIDTYTYIYQHIDYFFVLIFLYTTIIIIVSFALFGVLAILINLPSMLNISSEKIEEKE